MKPMCGRSAVDKHFKGSCIEVITTCTSAEEVTQGQRTEDRGEGRPGSFEGRHFEVGGKALGREA